MREQGKSLHAGGAQDPSQLSQFNLVERIRQLISEEPFAVLCTQGGGQPYGSVVAVAFSDDLRGCCFTTSTATRKYRLLTECAKVALVVDNRDCFPGDLMRTSALTITGRAEQIEARDQLDRWSKMLVERHPYLGSFVAAPTTAVFKVEVARYLYVTRFQEVRQWVPA
jgi:nitroimidazol reductase NimA-like FMN-containing flavoprotein (pyridoxamine 5'-phosphate oxidase superfamily)